MKIKYYEILQKKNTYTHSQLFLNYYRSGRGRAVADGDGAEARKPRHGATDGRGGAGTWPRAERERGGEAERGGDAADGDGERQATATARWQRAAWRRRSSSPRAPKSFARLGKKEEGQAFK